MTHAEAQRTEESRITTMVSRPSHWFSNRVAEFARLFNFCPFDPDANCYKVARCEINCPSALSALSAYLRLCVRLVWVLLINDSRASVL